ncbi:MAG: carboxylating nicotinate-nucleotide diphosphorylase [Candidatus Aegiribacteria sp.]|nr:carboxylating nicotinate-nucleotide diphosphorylase [Candidatus Aegiribacteria sp.]MBD3294699.1 carboxylating nicotinate-nucleotide diphosphorylase [Candidatus Fermentibacteria bacterium]
MKVDWSDHLSVGKFVVANALSEDMALEDSATGALDDIQLSLQNCRVQAREELVVAGWFLLQEVYRQLSDLMETEEPFMQQLVEDGDRAEAGREIGHLHGSAHILLRGERIALNLLSRLSGIATLTDAYVKEVEGTGVEILDTRKTTPCLRALEKYAVRAGGGVNHRFNLYEMAMIKDNHIAAAGGTRRIGRMVKGLKELGIPVEVEVDSLKQLKQVMEFTPQRVLLDNMEPRDLRLAVRMAAGSGIYLEASGGIDLQTVGEVARTGVNGISSGELTHSPPSADIGFDWEIK